MDRRKFLQTVNAVGVGAVVPTSVFAMAGPSTGALPRGASLTDAGQNGVRVTRQIFLDTETTGLSAKGGDRIIEIGCVEVMGREFIVANKHFYLNPGRDSHEDALKVHGISSEFLRDKPRFEAMADELLEDLQGAEIIIHNAPFDVSFLNKELELIGRPPFGQFVGGVTDTLAMAEEMFPGKRNSLNALCDRLGVARQGRRIHGTLLNAELLAEVYIKLTGVGTPCDTPYPQNYASPMKLDLQAELLQRYPKFFRKPGMRLVDRGIDSDGEERMQDDTGPFDERGVECGDGWFALINRVCRACENEIGMLASQGVTKERWPRVAQIKEKIGRLCFYIRGQVSDELNEEKFRISEYESRRTCEQCGAPRPWQIGSWRTLCDSCAESAGAGMADYQTFLREHARVLAMLASRAE